MILTDLTIKRPSRKVIAVRRTIVFGLLVLETGKKNGQCIINIVSQFAVRRKILGIFDMNDELFLNEQVKVVAVFGDGLNPCRPLRFRRTNGREIDVTEIGLRHPSMRGKRMLHIFDATDGSADYRLEFDAERLVWYLTREADYNA